MSLTPKRDRLHSMDMVPEHAQDDVVWAVRELNKRQRSNTDILFELNDRLAVKGVPPISSSAFSRKAVRLKALRERSRIALEVINGVDDQSPEDDDRDTVKLGRVIMMLIADLVADGEDRSSKELKEIADAFRSIVTGQRLSSARKRSETDERDKAEAKAIAKTKATMVKVAREAGLSPEIIKQMRTEFLGLRSKPAEPDKPKTSGPEDDHDTV